MPSRASSETNSLADCSVSASAWRSKPARIGAVVNAFDAASPCGDPLPIVGSQCRHRCLDVVGGDRDQPDVGSLGCAELLSGDEVAAGRAGDIFGSSVSEMIDGATPMRASVNANVLRGPGHDEVARADQAQPAGADVAVDGAR